jgi:murein DD-endopeptidase MepM/ murein hydrolase activator NlpD
MGSSGKSLGIHLHYEIRTNGVAIDPLTFLSMDY